MLITRPRRVVSASSSECSDTLMGSANVLSGAPLIRTSTFTASVVVIVSVVVRMSSLSLCGSITRAGSSDLAIASQRSRNTLELMPAVGPSTVAILARIVSLLLAVMAADRCRV